MSNRHARRAALADARRAIRTGKWPEWKRETSPQESGSKHSGWFAQLDRAWSNGVYAVMARTLNTEWGAVDHVCIRNIDNSDIPWRDKQRIKDELFGAGRVAVEVFPAHMDLVDDAGMYHLWVLPVGLRLPFTLKESA